IQVATEIRSAEKCSRIESLHKARELHPELLAASRSAPLPPLAKVATKPPAVRAFEKKIDEIRASEKCSRTEAMEKARILYVDEWTAAYRAA
ncbi:MAG TPA: hypothetical protein VJ890_24945, partial [Vineibacter sp.]|nr:hypothetical protein [Vineibacter sp.]